MKTKRIPHNKIFIDISDKFNLSYHRGEGGFEPTNYHYFMDMEGKYSLIIEIIRPKKGFPIVYVMLHGGAREIEESLCDYIQKKYQECTIGQGVSWIIDFNTSRSSILF